MSNTEYTFIREWKTDTGITHWDKDRADLNLAIRAFNKAMNARQHAMFVIEEVTNRIGEKSDAYRDELKKMKDILEGKP